MRRTAIVTDSTVSLPRETTEPLGIRVVPMQIAVGDDGYRDGVDIPADEFYRMLRAGGPVLTTASPGAGTFLDTFRTAASWASGIVCMTLSRRYSSVFDSATAGAQLFREEAGAVEVRVLDSETAAGAQASLVLEVARQSREDAGPAELEALAESLKPRVGMVALLDTLEYVAKGGHVPRLAAWTGDLLRVKPILEMAPGGSIRLLERPRTRHRAIERLLELTCARARNPSLVNVVHGDSREEAEGLLQRVRTRLPGVECLLTQFSPVIGVHTGPGLLGVAFCAGSPAPGHTPGAGGGALGGRLRAMAGRRGA